MRIVFLTSNKGKYEEASKIIPGLLHEDVDLEEIQDVDSTKIIIHKLEEARKHVMGNLVIEDGSFYLDCLKGLPGPLVKWFLKTIGNEGLVDLTKKYGNDKAYAKVIVGLSSAQDDSVQFFEGTINGKIVEPRGEYGFGWDPIFQPEGFAKTFAEMTPEEKNEVSMRKIAFEKLKEYLHL